MSCPYFNIRRLGVFIFEVVLIFITSVMVAAIRFWIDGSNVVGSFFEYDPHFVKTSIITLTYLYAFYHFDLFATYNYRPSKQMIVNLIFAVLAASVVLFSLYFVVPSASTWRGILLANNIMVPLVILLWRAALSRWIIRQLPWKKVLIIGSGELARKTGEMIYSGSGLGLKLVGFIDDDPAKLGMSIVNPGVVGGYGDIAQIVKDNNIERIIIALKDRRARLPMSALLECRLRGVVIEESETFNEKTAGKIPLDHLKPSWMVFSNGFGSITSRKHLKRIEDILFSVIGLIFYTPLFIIIPILIKMDSRGPVLYEQERVGENGKVFTIYKFRTLKCGAEADTGPVWISSKSRVTRVGRVLRRLRLDEIPQIINVLKGDMSFVGPRPERPFFVKKLKKTIPYYEMRTVVKPGITGWTQVHYPYGASDKDAVEKLKYDIYYIKNMSPILDFLIFLLTIKTVIKGKGSC